ncbi:NUDIX hydrolase [Jiella sp. MQZ9-1]|uniref:NUDIX hydrolase n=1 Tax=Jiella flava TaxID=2816857 RepID=A0A939G0U1_9HYPH|nr:NUDIX hydrolase [Jiella flava]MBO0663760.1 NUDIX hydrolase [Jiella flava]MCD2472333.1 NUDIX hydrolase [Jiella flava]
MSDDEPLAALEAERRAVTARGVGAGGSATVNDAATVVIVDRSGSEPRILMGLRGRAHVFMANRFVFPGGRVDEADRHLAATVSLPGPVSERLLADVAPGFGPQEAAALTLAAVRETFEETGLVIGDAAADRCPLPDAFAAFAEAGLGPAVAPLVPVARAITPEGAPRRFDTRFFALDAERFAPVPEVFAPPTDEFETIIWVSTSALDDFSLAPITRTVLDDVLARIADGSWLDPRRKMPFYRVIEGRFARSLI